MRRLVTFVLGISIAWVLPAHVVGAQPLTGALIGTLNDVNGGFLAGALVRVTSSALIGGAERQMTNDRGSCDSRRSLRVSTCLK